METLTIDKLAMIGEFLGIDLYAACMAQDLKDKTFPKKIARNRFEVNDRPISSPPFFDQLVSDGYAAKGKFQEIDYYYLTDKGIQEYKKIFEKLVNYKPKDQRDLNYLKHRINTFCEFRHLRFCEDNSEHIISYYKDYWLKKYKVSHTTEYTIEIFRKELNYFYKKQII